VKQSKIRILIADDENDFCVIFSHVMKREGFEVKTVNSGKAALDSIVSEEPDVLLTDFRMPDLDGMGVLNEVKERNPELPVIMITGYADIHGAVTAMKHGAYDYLAKPIDHIELVRVVCRAVSERRLRQEIKFLSAQCQKASQLRKRMGPSDAVGRIISDVEIVSKSDFSVVIQAETGAGKELVARAIHDNSTRSKEPFVPIDCGSIPETLFESELFGHEKGAFTGAVAPKLGRLEAAKGGTIFLDEISNMPMGSQAKLLRILQEKKVLRLGATKPIPIDVRIVAASNKDLLGATVTAEFRLDLFFRLNEFAIAVPPLRKRKEDIPYLAKAFLDSTNNELNKNVNGFSKSAVESLLRYHWPGNVREMRSVIRRAVLMADQTITEKHLGITEMEAPAPAHAPMAGETPREDVALREMVHQGARVIEREALKAVLASTGGNKAKAARILQIDYKTMYRKLKLHGIQENGG
jgi:DNA-binding NtrC family response regulator